MKYLFLLCLLFSLSFPSFASQSERPKLAVMIVIDQFRADYLMRFRSEFLPGSGKNGKVGGFRYLMEKGAYFPLGEHDVAQNMTAPGHATVLTGAYPYQSGIPINNWFDRKTRKIVSATAESTFLPVGAGQLEQKVSGSPKRLVATTLGDELKNEGYSSRVISIALKEGPAIFLGGHRADLALWYESKSHQWISSEYYLRDKKLPQWVTDLNQDIPTLVDANSPKLLKTPSGVKLTLEAAKRTITSQKLGHGKATDLLAISISSHDIAGHQHGPNSHEIEEMTYAEDQYLSDFFNFIQKNVPGGLKSTLIALTADHGVAPIPEEAQANHLDAGRIDEQEITDKINARLNDKFGKPSQGNWVFVTLSFNVYFDPAAIADKKIKLSDLEAEAKLALQEDSRIAYSVTSSEIAARILPPGMFERQILHGFYPERSGNLLILFKPHYIPKGSGGAVANHITGYSYDRTVPILFAGPQIKPGTYATLAHVVDIAPTLSYLLRVLPPSLSEGRVLAEIIRE